MSQVFERLVGRAVIDKQFRGALLADPGSAVKGAGFILSPDQLVNLKGKIAKINKDMTPEQLDKQFDTDLRAQWCCGP